jgi:hypothetical protein
LNMRKSLSNSLAIGLFSIAGSLLNMPQKALADPPSCAPFSDSGCFFGENWENGTVSGWAVNAPSNFSNVSPGLNGTNRTAQLHYAGVDAGIWADTAVSHTGFDGEVVWIEFYVKWPTGFTWAAGPAGVAVMKTFEVYINAPTGTSCSGRLLLATRSANVASTMGQPGWALYPNDSQCGGAGRIDDEAWGSINVTGGNTYHFVIELKTASGSNGYIKMWIDDQLSVNRTGIQTASNPALGWNYVRIGGQYGNPSPPKDVLYDQIRITKTNLAPLAQQLPVSPTSLTLK